MVDKMEKGCQRKVHGVEKSLVGKKTNEKWWWIPYLEGLDRSVCKLQSQSIHAPFKSNRSLKPLLCEVNDKVEVLHRSGNRISLPWGASYAFQSGTVLRRSYKNLTYNSSEMFCHTVKEDHNQEALNVQILHNGKKGLKMNVAWGHWNQIK